MKIRVLHVISGLEQGGAERTLANLATGAGPSFEHAIAPLRDGGFWRDRLAAAGCCVHPLGLNRATDAPRALARLVRLTRAFRPQIVQSWLYHADLLATLAHPFAPNTQLVWTLRNSDLAASERSAWSVLRTALALASRAPSLVVANSERGLADHIAAGYRPRRTLVIANGVDCDLFRPQPQAEARRRLGLPESGLIVGMAARWERFKDHATFLRSARLVRERNHAVRFALAGKGVVRETSALAELVAQEKLEDAVFLLGPIEQAADFYNALDVAVLSSSHGEGFPNAIAEAMACGRAAVGADVGDAARLIGDAGVVAPPRDPHALAEAVSRLLDDPQARLDLGARARARVAQHYSLKQMIDAYERLYRELAPG